MPYRHIPHFSDDLLPRCSRSAAIVCINPSDGGPRVRIHLPPARSHVRTRRDVGERIGIAREVRTVFYRIIDPRQKFLVMFDRILDKPGIQAVRDYVALLCRALLTGSLSEAGFAFFWCHL